MMPEIVFVALFGAVAAFMAVAATRDWLRRRQVRRLLRLRPQLPDEAFAKAYFADSPAKAQVAVELRQLLAENLKQRLDGLRPDDGLEVDLFAELAANPDLFWEIERRFGVTFHLTEDWKEHERLLRTLHTFRHLVEHIARETPANPRTGTGAVRRDL